MKQSLLVTLLMTLTACSPQVSRDIISTLANDAAKNGVIGGGAPSSERARAIVRLSTECSGSLISSQFVLTAGHCLPEDPKEPMTVEVVSSTGKILERRNVIGRKGIFEDSEMIDSDFTITDLALLKLESPLEAEEKFALPENDEIPLIGERFFAGGFGLTAPFGNSSDVVKEVLLKLVATEKSHLLSQTRNSKWPWDIFVMDQSLDGVCSGDSGGPLYKKIKKDGVEIWHVIGVVNSVKRTQDTHGDRHLCVYNDVFNPRKKKSESATSNFVAVRPHMKLIQKWIQSLNNPD